MFLHKLLTKVANLNILYEFIFLCYIYRLFSFFSLRGQWSVLGGERGAGSVKDLEGGSNSGRCESSCANVDAL